MNHQSRTVFRGSSSGGMTVFRTPGRGAAVFPGSAKENRWLCTARKGVFTRPVWFLFLAAGLACAGSAAGMRRTGEDSCVISGKTVDDRGTGIAGATITICAESFFRRLWTDSSGTFRAEGLPPDQYRLHARAPGHEAGWYGGASRPEARLIDLSAGGVEAEPVEFRLTRLAALQGQVVNALGEAAAQINLRLYRGDQLILTVRTGTDGTFRYGDLAAGVYSLYMEESCALFRPEKPCYAGGWYRTPGETGAATTIQLEAGQTIRELRAVIPHHGLLTGRVLGPGGRPEPDCILFVQGLSSDPWNKQASAVTGADGRYALFLPAAGAYSLRCESPDTNLMRLWYPGVPYLKEAVPLTIAPGEMRALDDFRLRPGGSLAGRVVDAAGQGLAEVMISAEDSSSGWYVSTGTDQDGGFRFDGMAPGKYVLHVLPDSWSPAPFVAVWYGQRYDSLTASCIELADGQHKEGLEIRVATDTGISGRLADGNGDPCPFAGIILYRKTSGASPELLEGHFATGSDGSFIIAGLPAGQYRLWIQPGWHMSRWPFPAWYPPAASDGSPVWLEVRAGRETSCGTIETPPHRSVSGVVMNPEGQPAGDTAVSIWNETGEQLDQTRTGDDGEFCFPAAPAAPFRLRTGYFCQRGKSAGAGEWYPDANRPEDALLFPPGLSGIEGIIIRLDPPGWLACTPAPGGNPLVSGMIVEVYPDGDGTYCRRFLAKAGRFMSEPLRPGRYHLLVIPAGVDTGGWWHDGQSSRDLAEAVEIRAGEFTRVELRTPLSLEPEAPVLSAPETAPAGEEYTLRWDPRQPGFFYQLEEDTTPAFTNPESYLLTGGTARFTRDGTAPAAWYYRVRALRGPVCGGRISPWSEIRVVVVQPR